MVFSDDIGMAAAFSAGGIKARVDAHLDAGCDVVLVCHPELVEESLAAVSDRTLNTMAVANLIARGPLAWEFVQVFRPNRTFDWQDVWATLAGGLLFLAIPLVGRGLSAAPAPALPGALAPGPENSTS